MKEALEWCSDVAFLVFGSIIRGSSLNANYHKVDELCGSQITSFIHCIFLSCFRIYKKKDDDVDSSWDV